MKKLLLPLCISALSLTATANEKAEFGVHYKNVFFDVESELDSSDTISVASDLIAFEYNQNFSDSLEAGVGLAFAIASSADGEINSERFSPNGGYILSAQGKYKPLGKTGFRPYLLGTLSYASLSYEYSRFTTFSDETVSYFSSGMGIGFEFNITENTEFDFKYSTEFNDSNVESMNLGVNFQF